jgi:hypothetical protein
LQLPIIIYFVRVIRWAMIICMQSGKEK